MKAYVIILLLALVWSVSAPSADWPAAHAGGAGIPRPECTSKICTPGNNHAVIFDPIAFDLNLRLNADGNRDTGIDFDSRKRQQGEPPFYQPAVQALTGEGYDVSEITDGVESAWNEPASVTETKGFSGTSLLNFGKLSGKGVVIIIAHGGQGETRPRFLVECHSAQAEQHQVWNDLGDPKSDLHKAGWRQGDVTLDTVNGLPYLDPGTQREQLATGYCLSVKEQGVMKHWQGDHSLVYLVMCHSVNMLEAFTTHGADYGIGYQGAWDYDDAVPQFKTFWKDMDGTKWAGKQQETSDRRRAIQAFKECCVGTTRANGNPVQRPEDPTRTQLVLAPSVATHIPTFDIAPAIGDPPLEVRVTFDAPLADVDASKVLTATGCGATHTVPLHAQPPEGWSASGRTLRLYFQVPPVAQTETLTFTVHSGGVANAGGPGMINGLARSKFNQVSLDGNQNPAPNKAKGDGPVRPNGDDYIWTIACKPVLNGGNMGPPPGGGAIGQQTPTTGNDIAPGASAGGSTQTPTPTSTATPVPQRGSAQFSLAALSFPAQAPGTTSAGQPVTVTNIGPGPLAFSSVALSGPDAAAFVVQGDTCTGSVPPEGTCQVQLAFQPSSAGSDTASLVFTDSAADSPQQVSVMGTAGVPSLTVSATTLAFAAGAQQRQDLTITNVGTAPTVIAVQVAGGAFAVTGDGCAGQLVPEASCQVEIAYVGNGSDAVRATLTLAYPGGSQSVTLQFMLQAVPVAAPEINPAALSFSGASSGQVVTLTNPGDTALSIASVAISGADAASFHVSADTCVGSLAARASCQVDVEYVPGGVGSDSASLVFTDNAPNTPQSVSLAGTLAARASASLRPTTLTFAGQNVGVMSADQAVTLTNSGDTPITVSSVSLSGSGRSSFVLGTNTCTSALPPLASCTVQVAFDPTTAGAAQADLQFLDTAANSPQIVALSGMGVSAPSAGSAGINFGAVRAGTTSAVFTGRVTNTGDTAFAITGTGISGVDARAFNLVSNGCAGTLAPGASCLVQLVFHPPSTGQLDATLMFETSPQVSALKAVTLTGTGI